MQETTDTEFGRLMEGLRQRGLWNKTIIAFSSDNGPESYYNNPNSVGTTGPFRGQKRALYDGGIRMPLILKGNGPPQRGRVDDHSLVSAVDWLPTVLALAGVPAGEVTPSLRGHDISATFTGPGRSLGRPADKPLLWEYRGGVMGPCWWQAPQLAAQAVAGGYKLLMDPPHPKGARVELYNRSGREDLAEMQNLAEILPDEVEKLRGPLFAFYEAVQKNFPGPVQERLGCASDMRAWKWPPVV